MLTNSLATDTYADAFTPLEEVLCDRRKLAHRSRKRCVLISALHGSHRTTPRARNAIVEPSTWLTTS